LTTAVSPELSWRQLVTLYRRKSTSAAAIEAILEKIEPLLQRMLTTFPEDLQADLLQAARIKLWRVLPRIDLRRSNRSIGAMLRRTATNAIRDEWTRLHRLHRRAAQWKPEHADPAGSAAEDPQTALEFGGILALYVRHIRQTGSFAGAHRAVARQRGVSAKRASDDFRRAARAWLDQHGLSDPPTRYARIVARILAGRWPR